MSEMSDKLERFLRFSFSDRVLHLLLAISFTVLAITGLVQKYANSNLSVALIRGMGGIEQVRVFHHTFAVVLILTSIVHMVQVGYRIFVQRKGLSMLPRLSDFRDFLAAVKYNLGLTKQKPRYPRFNFIEKIEYWAVAWGTALMTITGYALWNPVLTSRLFPGEVIPAAKIAHGLEAVLAVLSILVWHSYFVHLKVFNKSIFTGYLSQEEMEEEHAAELEQIRSGRVWQPPSPEVRYQRLKLYAPLATLFVLVSVLGTWRWLTAETTAITTVPRQAVVEEVYKPVLPTPRAVVATPQPLPTPLAVLQVANLTTYSPEDLLIPHAVTGDHAQCDTCHGVFSMIRPAPLDHAEYGLDTCQTCHSPVGGAP